MASEKSMRAIRKVTVEQVVQPEENEPLHLEGITIAGKEYKLDITNSKSIEGEESLVFDFNEGDYRIIVDREGVRFERYVARPNHDHGDMESLQIKIDDSRPGPEKGTILWRSRFPHRSEEYEHYEVPFDARDVGY